jgi:dTDP-4-dehydrorhamnose 3,5-epimerase
MTPTDHETRANHVVRDATGSGKISGVVIRELTVNRDPRGTLTELLRRDWPDVYGEEMQFAQSYVSMTMPGIARDEDKWHVHQRQTDRFYCLAGRIVIAIADPRPDSPTTGNLMLVELTASEDAPAPLVVTIPPQTLHGFVVTSSTAAILANFPNQLYDPDDEGRLPFGEARVTFSDGEAFSYERVRSLYV